MPLRYVNVELCKDRPEAFKLCTSGICVDMDVKCPTSCERTVEYRCRNGDCIPLRQKCDGIKHCRDGEDEHRCPGRMTSQLEPHTQANAVSPPLLIVLVSLSVILCVLICLLVFVYVTKRRKNNTSRDSQSVTVPLKKKFVVEVSDVYDKCDKNTQNTVTDCHHDNNYKQQHTRDTLNDSRTSLDSQEYKLYEKLKNSQNRYWGNLGLLQRHNEIYAMENDNKTPARTQKRGKYMYRPRLKSMEQEASINPDDIRLNVALNSYRHFSGKISLPVTFDPEPETFASDLLCASTPRQAIRRLVKEGGTDTASEKVTLNTDLVVKPNCEQDEVL